VNVTNDGEVAGDNRTVELRLVDPGNASNASALGAENVSLGPGNTTTVSLSGTVPSGFGTGETTVTVVSPRTTPRRRSGSRRPSGRSAVPSPTRRRTRPSPRSTWL